MHIQGVAEKVLWYWSLQSLITSKGIGTRRRKTRQTTSFSLPFFGMIDGLGSSRFKGALLFRITIEYKKVSSIPSVCCLAPLTSLFSCRNIILERGSTNGFLCHCE